MESSRRSCRRSCCRNRRRSRRSTLPSTSLVPSHCRSPFCSASMRCPIGWKNSGAKALITNAWGVERIAEVRNELPALKLVLSLDGPGDGARGFADELSRASSDFAPVDTSPDDPAMMVYTSGTTGQPKGALHGHRVLIGHFPGVETHHDFLPQPGDRLWTPADWAWAGGLLNVLLPGLHYGVPVVARRFEKFDPEEAFALMARAQIRNAFIPPTALRMLRAAPNPKGRYGINMRSIGSAVNCLARKHMSGQIGIWPRHQRILRADRMQYRPRGLQRDRRFEGRERSASQLPDIRSESSTTTANELKSGETRPDCGETTGPRDVS